LIEKLVLKKIKLNCVIIRNQETAFQFYIKLLGLEKKMDLPAGDLRWLTVASPEEPESVQLLLEPSANPGAAAYQFALYQSGILMASFVVEDIEAECQRLKFFWVVFTLEPAMVGGTLIAMFDDTWCNLIRINQE
jgi:hypothetical protein